MGVLKIAECVVVAHIVVFGIVLFTPLRKWRGRKLAVLVSLLMAFSTGAGFAQAHAILDEWIGSKCSELRVNPSDATAFRYLAGDFLPAKLAIGGQIKPHVRELLIAWSRKEQPCESAMARALLGEAVNVGRACQ